MSTRIELCRELDGSVTFRGRIERNDIERIRLDHFDRLLLDDCNRLESSAADRLLALEMIFRRLQEQTCPPASLT